MTTETSQQLRPYQIAALEAVANRKIDRGIIALPTGTGKGHLAGHLTESLGTDRILYLAHRAELINQLADHVERVLGFGRVDVEQANQHMSGSAPAVIASVPTLTACNARRLRQFGQNRFGAIVVDECHHATAESYLAIWQHFGLVDENHSKASIAPIPLIGLTATPSRGDNVGLHNVFDEILYQMSLSDAIRQGWLVPVYAYTVRTTTSLDGIKTRMGDYAEGELARAVSTESRNAVIYDAYSKNAKDLKTLIFCVNIEHAEMLANHFDANGVPANHISGKMDMAERTALLDWFATTPGAVLTNCQIITEGVDIPSVECVIMARPTKSKTLYAQCLGRGTRLARGAANYAESVVLGKDRMILLDITDAVSDFGRRAVTISDIFGAPLPTKPLNGVEMLNEIEEQQKAIDAGGTANTEAIEVSLFGTVAQLPGMELTWVDYGGSYRLSLANSGSIAIISDALDRWQAVYKPGGRLGLPVELTAWQDRDAVLRAAEQYVQTEHKDSLILVTRNARWRKDPPSVKQIMLCNKFHIPVPPGASKGQVSIALDRFFANKQRAARA